MRTPNASLAARMPCGKLTIARQDPADAKSGAVNESTHLLKFSVLNCLLEGA